MAEAGIGVLRPCLAGVLQHVTRLAAQGCAPPRLRRMVGRARGRVAAAATAAGVSSIVRARGDCGELACQSTFHTTRSIGPESSCAASDGRRIYVLAPHTLCTPKAASAGADRSRARVTARAVCV